MPRYTLTGRYSAWRDGERLGPWARGTEVELEAEMAEWIGRDSPGILATVDEPAPVEPAPPPAERQARPARDRRHKGGANR